MSIDIINIILDMSNHQILSILLGNPDSHLSSLESDEGSFDLHEQDWVYISDYLDAIRIIPTLCLSTSSHGSSWCLRPRLAGMPWVTLLHHIDVDIQRIVTDLVCDGMLS